MSFQVVLFLLHIALLCKAAVSISGCSGWLYSGSGKQLPLLATVQRPLRDPQWLQSVALHYATPCSLGVTFVSGARKAINCYLAALRDMTEQHTFHRDIGREQCWAFGALFVCQFDKVALFNVLMLQSICRYFLFPYPKLHQLASLVSTHALVGTLSSFWLCEQTQKTFLEGQTWLQGIGI